MPRRLPNAHLKTAKTQHGAILGRDGNAKPVGARRRDHGHLREPLPNLRQATRMFGLMVRQQHGLKPFDPCRPDTSQSLRLRAAIEEQSLISAAVRHDVCVRNPDAVQRPHRIKAKRQATNLWQWVCATCDRSQPDRVKLQRLRQPVDLVRAQSSAIVDHVTNSSGIHTGLHCEVLFGEANATQRLLQDVTEFILERCAFDNHGLSMTSLAAAGKKVLIFPLGASGLLPMQDSQQEVLDIFTRTKALLQGHFVLRSGLHSAHFFQCARVCQDMAAVTRLTELLLPRLKAISFETVLAPAMGGLVIGQEVARQTSSRYIFAEKENNQLVLRRGFTFTPGERVLIVEDVVTRGGRVLECLQLARAAGAVPVAVAMLVDRSAGQARFDVPAISLLELSFPTYPADQLPPELARLPVEKPGS